MTEKLNDAGDVAADRIDCEIGVGRSFGERLAYAKKAVLSFVASVAVLAILLGFGDVELWAAIGGVVASAIGVGGVFYATNKDV